MKNSKFKIQNAAGRSAWGFLPLLLFSFLIFNFALSQPLPPGLTPPLTSPRATGSSVTRMAVSVPGQTNRSTFQIEIKDLRPEQIVSFYVSTNRPARWSIERSADLVTWTPLFKWEATNPQPAHLIPRLRDDARLVDWLIEKPQRAQFYRLAVLP